jgi:TatD DNase family protein
LPTPIPPFLNIHSHRKPSSDAEFVIRNAYLHSPLTQLPNNYRLSNGIHPWFTGKLGIQDFKILERAVHSSTCLAIGECGIDRVNGADLVRQLDVFTHQIELANRINKPLILHVVRSYSDVLQIAKSIHVPFIVHGFQGSLQDGIGLISKGACLSFGASILHKKNLQEVMGRMPLDKIYFETDVAQISIQEIYKAAAFIRNVSVYSLRMAIWSNFERDFQLTYDY